MYYFIFINNYRQVVIRFIKCKPKKNNNKNIITTKLTTTNTLSV